MNADRRILTPIAATVMAALVVGVATLGGTISADRPAVKGDRFAMIGDNLCDGQVWPNLTPECLAWAEGETQTGPVRFVTIGTSDPDLGITQLERGRLASTN